MPSPIGGQLEASSSDNFISPEKQLEGKKLLDKYEADKG